MPGEPEPNSETPPQEGVSLDALTAAFAQAIGPREDAGPAGAEESAGSAIAQVPAPAEPEAADACPISPQTIVEAMLFVGTQDGQPLVASRAAELMRGVEPGEIAGLVDALNQRYAARGSPYHIASEGAGYRLTLRKPFHPLRERFYGHIREARLSQAAIDVLAIVAYRQPVTAEVVNRLRGKPSNRVLGQLVRRGLLGVERPDPKTQIVHYRTAQRFLELFGLESLEDLPKSEELGQ